MKKILVWIVIPGVVLFLGFVVYTFSSIYKGVERITITAKTEFQGDAVHSLIDLVHSENYDFEEKNQAIWAIGQYADLSAVQDFHGFLILGIGHVRKARSLLGFPIG